MKRMLSAKELLLTPTSKASIPKALKERMLEIGLENVAELLQKYSYNRMMKERIFKTSRTQDSFMDKLSQAEVSYLLMFPAYYLKEIELELNDMLPSSDEGKQLYRQFRENYRRSDFSVFNLLSGKYA